MGPVLLQGHGWGTGPGGQVSQMTSGGARSTALQHLHPVLVVCGMQGVMQAPPGAVLLFGSLELPGSELITQSPQWVSVRSQRGARKLPADPQEEPRVGGQEATGSWEPPAENKETVCRVQLVTHLRRGKLRAQSPEALQLLPSGPTPGEAGLGGAPL